MHQGFDLWYLVGFQLHGSLDNWLGGVWPSVVGPLVSLGLTCGVSCLTVPPPDSVAAVFFSD